MSRVTRKSVSGETATNTSPLAFKSAGKGAVLLRNLQEIPGNKWCIECKTPQPTWASITMGCLVCLECSGKHRGLGVHYSFVRSVDLDNWNDEQVSFMQHGGNTRLATHFQNNNLGPDSPIGEKYRSVAAERYRRSLNCLAKHYPAPPDLTQKEINQIEQDAVKLKEKKSKAPKPKWTPDKNSAVCEECFAKFNLLKRRHHCRKCGRLVCEKCAPKDNSKPLLTLGIKEPVRHCLQCYHPPTSANGNHVGHLSP